MHALLLLVLLALLGVAGGESGAVAPPPGVRTEATVTVWPRGPGAGRPLVWTLLCDPSGATAPKAGGAHPRPIQACKAVVDGPMATLRPLPRRTACTEQYGGPQVAELRGLVRGKRVRLRYDRADGCGIARWDALRALFHIRI